MDSLASVSRLKPRRSGLASGLSVTSTASVLSTSSSGAVCVAISTPTVLDVQQMDGTTAPASASGSTSFEHELTRTLEAELAWVMASTGDLAYIEALKFVLYLRSHRA